MQSESYKDVEYSWRDGGGAGRRESYWKVGREVKGGSDGGKMTSGWRNRRQRR